MPISVEEELKNGHSIEIHPRGTSMWPLFLHPEDRAVLVPIKDGSWKNSRGVDRKLKRSDVCVYRGSTGRLTIHRIHHVSHDGEENTYYFVGDHQTEIEGPISEGVIFGRMVEFVRKGKRHNTSNLWYQLYSHIWLWLRPYRVKMISFGSKVKQLI